MKPELAPHRYLFLSFEVENTNKRKIVDFHFLFMLMC